MRMLKRMQNESFEEKDGAVEAKEDPTVLPKFKRESKTNKALKEDTAKRGGKWVNVGKDGKANSGKFKTKKAADAQRRAMYANGYKGESLDEAIHGKEEISGFLKMAKQIGIRTIDELAKFLRDNKQPGDKDEYETMLRYRASLGNDFKIDPTVNESQEKCECGKFKKDDFEYDDDYTTPMMECDDTVEYDDDYRINYGE